MIIIILVIAKNFVLSLNPNISSKWLGSIEEDDLTSKSKFHIDQICGAHPKYRFDQFGEYLIVKLTPIYYCYKIKSLTLVGNIAQRLSRLELACVSKLNLRDENREQFLSKFAKSDYGINQDKYREED